jgi:filamentous hemagglutinin family protein
LPDRSEKELSLTLGFRLLRLDRGGEFSSRQLSQGARTMRKQQVGQWVAGSIVTFLCAATPALAQITPDGTLGAERSVVTPSERIEGGATRGVNLFHSFREFNVGELQRVYFANPAGISNILTRVTGSTRSEIRGLLGVDGGANLFLLNPNGILFGPNARLDIRGSFVASTASSFRFGDGSEFSSTDPQAPPLLMVSLVPGLQYGARAIGDIQNEASLAVAPGQSLTLFGNTVTSRGSLVAPGGTVQVLGDRVGLFGNALVDVSSPTGGGTVLIGGDFQGKGTVPNATETFVGANAVIKADAIAAGNGGKVIVWGDRLTRFFGSISAQGGASSGNGGLVEVSGKESLVYSGQVNTGAAFGTIGTLLLDPTDIEVNSGSLNFFLNTVDQFSDANFPGSTINVFAINSATSNVVLQATNNITFNATINMVNFGVGLTAQAGNNIFVNQPITTRGGGITLITDDLTSGFPSGNGSIFVNSQINAREANLSLKAGGDIIAANGVPFGSSAFTPSGNTGNVMINAGGRLVLPEGADILTFDSTTGNKGNLIIAAKSIEISGISSTTGKQGGLFTSSGTGNSGNILINTERLSISNGAAIDAGTDGVGNAGSITIYARAIEIDGTENNGFVSGIRSQSYGSGAAGNMTVEARQVLLRNGATFSTTATGAGDAGELVLRKVDSLTLQNQAQVISASKGTGDAGKLVIEANSVVASGQSIIASTALGSANAADLSIQASSVEISGQSYIASVATGGGNAANLSINVRDSLILSNDSFISASSIPGSVPGNILIGTSQLNLSQSSIGNDRTTDLSNAGGLSIRANSIRISDKSVLSADSFTIGNGSNLSINTGDLLVQNNSIIRTSSNNLGEAGNLTIQANSVTLANNSEISTNGTVSGRGADLSIHAGELNLTNSQILKADSSGGDAGSLTVHATGSALISDASSISVNGFAGGTGSNISVEANRLTIQNGSSLTTSLASQGNAGNLTVHAPSSIVVANGSSISVDSTTLADGGNVLIDTGNLSLQDSSSIRTLIQSAGDAGDFEVRASNSLVAVNNSEISTNGAVLEVGSRFSIQTGNLVLANSRILKNDSSGGNAGDFRIDASGTALMTNSSTIAVNGVTGGTGGDVSVEAGRLLIQDGSSLATNLFSQGNAGNFTVLAPDLIKIANSSSISIGTVTAANSGNVLISTNKLDIQGSSKLTISTSSVGNAGDVQIYADHLVSLVDNSEISTNNLSGENGSNIAVNTGQLLLNDYSGIFKDGQSGGNAGDLTIHARNSIAVTNSSFISADGLAGRDGSNVLVETPSLTVQNFSEIGAATASLGKASSLTIHASDSVNLLNSSILQTSATGSFNGGDLSIETRALNLQSLSQIGSLTIGTGSAGNINVHAADFVNLDQSSIVAQAIGTGSGGNINITTEKLTAQGVTGEASISTIALGSGNAGNIAVTARESATLSGGAAITTSSFGGSGGDILVNTSQLIVQNKAQIATAAFDPDGFLNDPRIVSQLTPTQLAFFNLVQSIQTANPAHSSQASAGNLQLNAIQSIDLASGAIVSTSGTGRAIGGDLSITTDRLKIDSATVTAGTIGLGTAGNIGIRVREMRLDRGGNVNANSTSGDGGNIDIQNFDLLLLRRGSFISTTAGLFEAGGDGGNIGLQGKFILAPVVENSDIKANAFDGRGGRVDIKVEQIFGMVLRSRQDLIDRLGTSDPRKLDPIQLKTNDITAISQNNPSLNGRVVVTNLGVDPSRALNQLPVNLPPPPIDRGCQATGKTSTNTGRFAETGRGGLPLNPNQVLNRDALWSDRPTPPVAASPPPAPESAIVEAQGLITQPDGSLYLTANTTPTQPPVLLTSPCNDR